MCENNSKTELPLILKIDKVVNEAKNTVSLVFNHSLNAIPGQFLQVWIPRIEEKPFSISFQNKGKFAVTIQAVGDFSRKLCNLNAGDIVGIRGPYGNGFNLENSKVDTIVTAATWASSQRTNTERITAGTMSAGNGLYCLWIRGIQGGKRFGVVRQAIAIAVIGMDCRIKNESAVVSGAV